MISENQRMVLELVAGRRSGMVAQTEIRDAARAALDALTAPAKVEVPHDESQTWHQWVFLGGWNGHEASVRRDAIGRKHPRARREWIVLECNNTECPAVGIVRIDFLTSAMQAVLPVPTPRRKP